MGFFYKVTPKELLDLRNKIIIETAIPFLIKSGFKKSPFSTAWFGRNEHGGFNYELCRLTSSQLEIIDIYIARGERWVKFKLNIFELKPTPDSIEKLNNIDGLQFHLPPNSLTNMHWRSDDIKGPPLFKLKYMFGHKIKLFWTKSGLIRSVKRLTKIIETDLDNLGYFKKRWFELHHPLTTSWTGHEVKDKGD
jgi:hypothetical protein